MVEWFEVTELTHLLERMQDDAMTLRDVEMPTGEVVFFKSLIEAYPGVAAIHAVRGAAKGPTASLIVATTAGLVAELDAMLDELAHEIEGLVWKQSVHTSVGQEAPAWAASDESGG